MLLVLSYLCFYFEPPYFHQSIVGILYLKLGAGVGWNQEGKVKVQIDI